jgi:two-component system, OmpR family, sensor histidine kinase BaeS
VIELAKSRRDGSPGWRLGLRSKLFVALLVSAILAVAATSIAARHAFLRGFLGYLHEQEMIRIRRVVPTLAVDYEEQGGWDYLLEDPGAWFDILTQVDFGRGRAQPVSFGPLSSFEGPPPGFGPRPDFDSPQELTGLGMRLALLDARRGFVVGNPTFGKHATYEPIEVKATVVGWLVVPPFNRVTAGAASAFQRQQLLWTWIIASVAVGLAALLALVLTHHMLAPIRSIGEATHRLAAGNYATRLEVTSPDEIGRLAEDFNRMALTLQRNESVRRRFVADLSHELRTPIAILRAELEAIEDRVHELTAESLRSLQSEIATLGKLIEQLYELSLADVGALTYSMSPVNLVELLRGRLLAFQERYAEQLIMIDARLPADPLLVDADETRLHQLFNNLLENSLRYTESGGLLYVGCHVEGDAALIELQDTAPGVPDELLPRLFEQFYRVDPSRNRKSDGAGLGLAIAKRIVEAHGGSIVARQSPLGGLSIQVKLALAG